MPATRSELARRVRDLEDRVDWLDEHGTRGVDGIRVTQAGQAVKLGEISVQVCGIAERMDAMAGQRRSWFIACVLAFIPVYVLLFLAAFASTRV